MAATLRAVDVDSSSLAYFAAGTVSTSGKLLHVSGQPGSNAGQIPADYESQIHLALLNLHRIIIAANATISDIAKLNLYIVNYNPKNRLHTRHLQKWLGTHRPAITLVPVLQLAVPEWLLEIDAVVVLPSKIQRSLPDNNNRGTRGKTTKDVDVVIIGAGLSGLTAAEAVIKAGHSCIVLEARDRVGGRTWSRALPRGDGIVDLGAAWINDSNQSRMIALARRAGVELITQNTDGNCLLQTEAGAIVKFAYGTTPVVGSFAHHSRS